ncbi:MULTISPECIES: EpsG family protein [Raoultella]|uniref:EpsG family protein n=1 Tax=Raoultella TaxID=160674 RepID=UPI0025AAC95B|nr:EpsG family protein [Raoultella planticola]MDM9663675.1 EpsG family protein [Raoultella planticola]
MVFLFASLLLMICSLYNRRVVFIVSSFVISLYFITTYGYGYDWINYYLWYNNLDSELTPIVEPGFYFLMKTSNTLGITFGQFMSLISIFNYTILFLFCRRFKSSAFVFFCLFSFYSYFMYSVQLRQGIAISVLLMGLKFDDNFNLKKSYFWYIIAASFFHVSAIFSILYIVLNPKNINSFKRNMILLSLSMVIIISIYLNPNIISFIPYVGDKVYAYRKSFEQYNDGLFSFFIMLVVSKYTILYFSMMILTWRCYLQSKDNSILKSTFSFYFLMLTKSSPFLLRFGYYFVPSVAIGLDNYMAARTNNKIFYIKKTLIHLGIFVVSSSTLWSPAAFESTFNVLNIFTDNQYVIEKNIQEKCNIVYKNKFSTDVLTYCYR